MDLFYNHVISPAFKTTPLPPNPLQRRLACLSAGVMNIISGVLFLTGYPTIALINGGILIFLQAIVIATHFCTLSWIYEWIMRALGKWNTPLELSQVQKLLDQGALLVDVRGKDEYDRGHLPNAVNLPLDTLQTQCEALKQKNILLYCASGMRSHIATELLRKNGVEFAHDLGAMDRVKSILKN
jgi:rhodanese-related sulfurtransferase